MFKTGKSHAIEKKIKLVLQEVRAKYGCERERTE